MHDRDRETANYCGYVKQAGSHAVVPLMWALCLVISATAIWGLVRLFDWLVRA